MNILEPNIENYFSVCADHDISTGATIEALFQASVLSIHSTLLSGGRTPEDIRKWLEESFKFYLDDGELRHKLEEESDNEQ